MKCQSNGMAEPEILAADAEEVRRATPRPDDT